MQDDSATRVQHIVAANLRRIRKERGFAQEHFALHAGVSRGYYGRVERGEHSPSVTTLVRFAEALDVSVFDLLEGLD